MFLIIISFCASVKSISPGFIIFLTSSIATSYSSTDSIGNICSSCGGLGGASGGGGNLSCINSDGGSCITYGLTSFNKSCNFFI